MALDDMNMGEVVEQATGGVANLLNGGGSLGSVKNSYDVGRMFLALTDNTNSKYNAADPNSPDDSIREVGARAAFERWGVMAQLRLERQGLPAGANDVRAEMINEVKEQLVALNNGNDLHPDALGKIDALMSGDSQAFADAIVANSELVVEAREQHKVSQKAKEEAANAAGKKFQPEEMAPVGIMAFLIQPEDGDGAPKSVLDKVDVSDVGLSPEEQMTFSMNSAYNGMHAFANMGGGAEKALAQIAGVSWGKFTGNSFDGNDHTYEGINPMIGLGGLEGQQRIDAIEAFASSEGIAKIHDNHPYYQNYQLTDTSTSGAVNIQKVFFTPMEENGLISIDSDADREAMIQHVKEGLLARDSADELRTRIEKAAEARSGVRLASESEADNASGLSAEEVNRAVEAREQQAAVRAQEAQAGGQQQAQQQGQNAGEDFAANNVGVDENDPVAVQAAADLNEIVNGASQQAALDESQRQMGQYGAAAVTEAAFTQDRGTADRADVNGVNTDIPMVPVVMAGLNPTQTPMPVQMGYGVEQNAPAMNSNFEPRGNA